jgi:coproporphyrinogen III oxidase
MSKELVIDYFQKLQDSICDDLNSFDSAGKFTEDKWEHHSGGGGRTRTFQGEIIEKGGVNFSAVEGVTSESLQKQLQISEELNFTATGVSIVLHPHNPFVPIIHMNVRYFELSNGTYWFGGGIDLTPHFVFEEDCIFFHSKLKETCDKHDVAYYPKFKKWADDYFFIGHREETRGIGGIFFDQFKENDQFTREQVFAFVKDVGEIFTELYITIAQKRYDLPFTESDKKWQFVRRGRYVEFNLVWDRGTKFGLESGGRTESILMSLPPTAQWFYDFQPQKNTAEEISMRYFKKGIDWVA